MSGDVEENHLYNVILLVLSIVLSIYIMRFVMTADISPYWWWVSMFVWLSAMVMGAWSITKLYDESMRLYKEGLEILNDVRVEDDCE